MKVSYRWLSELAEITLEPAELAEKLTMVGLPVDSVERVGGDHIIELDLTSNRPDALSHAGVAREAALICGTSMRRDHVIPTESAEPIDQAASVEILDPDLCPRYAARVIKGVKVGPSPKWLVDRIEAIGQRSVNNIADITNYVMFEMGQPTHAFDLDRLGGRRIIVRRARPGEALKTLDGFLRTLSAEMLVIADSNRPVALAGIMGGEETEISATTSNVLLESAYFDPTSIRKTSRTLGLDSEASHRFERGADFSAQVLAADRAANLIAEIAGGRVLQGAVDVYPRKLEREPVRLRESRIERLSGLRVDIDRAAEILTALEFSVEPERDRRTLTAVAPPFRVDIAREEDLVEEVARHAGYDKIGATLPAWGGSGAYLPDENRRREVRRVLTHLGFCEAVSFSFVNEGRDALFRPKARPITLSNPIDSNATRMRTSLLTGLLDAVQVNFNQGSRDVKLFEIGRVFEGAEGDEKPIERKALALVMTGSVAQDDWRGKRPIDFYDLKGAVEAVTDGMLLSGFTFERASVEYLHPGQSAVVERDGSEVACLGRLHPRIASIFKFRQPVYLAEIAMDKLLELPSDEARYSALPRLPSSSRDVSALMPGGVTWANIERAVLELGIREIAGVSVFDVYRGHGVPEGMCSVAFRVVYRAEGRTLTDEELSTMHGRVRQMLEAKFGAQLR